MARIMISGLLSASDIGYKPSPARETCHILLACMPKSGSTFLSTIISQLPDFIRVDLVPSYGRREQELSESFLKKYDDKSFVAQHHVRCSQQTELYIKNYRLIPIVLVRNLYDIVVSLHDHMLLQSPMTPVAYLTQDMLTWTVERRLQAIVDLAIPWYFNFFVSWMCCKDSLFVTYEDLVADPLKMLEEILQFCGLSGRFTTHAVLSAIETAESLPTRKNVARTGRGMALEQPLKDQVFKLTRHYPTIDFRLLGLNREHPQAAPLKPSELDIPHDGPLKSTSRSAVRLDLGCGTAKPGGFIGLDRFPLDGVDIVADLNNHLPFIDNSIDLILCSHSLEHVIDLMATMKELYRIGRHGTQVCIVAPYGHQALNAANPYHRQVFNEHTPRFWTHSPHTFIEETEYVHPHAPSWGLSGSDHSSPNVDFRCLRMEFFYFREYRHLSPAEQREARKRYMNVCDQVMYHLVVLKKPVSESEMKELPEHVRYYDPPPIAVRRLQEQVERLQMKLAELNDTLQHREEATRDVQERFQEKAVREQKELAELREALQHRERATREVEERFQEQVEHQKMELAELRDLLQRREQELHDLQKRLSTGETALNQVENRAELRDRKIQSLEKRVEEQAAVLGATQEVLKQREAASADLVAQLYRHQVGFKRVCAELDRQRNYVAGGWYSRFINRTDLRNQTSEHFQQLKDDSYLFTKDLRGYRLQPSINLQFVPFVYYPLELNRPKLAGILLAPLLDIPMNEGALGVEIVSPSDKIVVHTTTPLSRTDDGLPTRFDFLPIEDSDSGRFWLRVFVQGVKTPVRVLEWKKYPYLGLGRARTRAFCGFVFQ